jgi:hypothetical protein
MARRPALVVGCAAAALGCSGLFGGEMRLVFHANCSSIAAKASSFTDPTGVMPELEAACATHLWQGGNLASIAEYAPRELTPERAALLRSYLAQLDPRDCAHPYEQQPTATLEVRPGPCSTAFVDLVVDNPNDEPVGIELQQAHPVDWICAPPGRSHHALQPVVQAGEVTLTVFPYGPLSEPAPPLARSAPVNVERPVLKTRWEKDRVWIDRPPGCPPMAMFRPHHVGEEVTWPLRETQSFAVGEIAVRSFTLESLTNGGTGSDYELRP